VASQEGVTQNASGFKMYRGVSALAANGDAAILVRAPVSARTERHVGCLDATIASTEAPLYRKCRHWLSIITVEYMDHDYYY
jgi:hypothetical protein